MEVWRGFSELPAMGVTLEAQSFWGRRPKVAGFRP